MTGRSMVDHTPDAKKINAEKLCLKLTDSANKVVNFLESKVQ